MEQPKYCSLLRACTALCANSESVTKLKAGDGAMVVSKTARTNGTRRASTARRTAAKRSGRRESWKKVLERNLVREGFSPAEAKELVAISAA